MTTKIFQNKALLKLLSTLGCSLIAMLALTSCLDENPKSGIDMGAAYNSAKNIELNCVATLYNYIGGNVQSQGLQGTYRGVYDWNSLTTDEQMIPTRGGDWYDGGFWQRLFLHTWKASDQALNDTWNYLYKVVMLCNQSLYQIESNKGLLTDAQYTAYTAEVRALRAIYYWYIMDMWGNVPIVTDYNIAPSNVTQSSRSTVTKFIVSELQEVEEVLPLDHSNYSGNYYGRVTAPVVWFVLAKIALNAGIYYNDDWTKTTLDGSNIMFTVDGKLLNSWQTVEAYCDRISGDGYSLQSSYASNFEVHNETSVENIWTIPMEKTLYAAQFGYLFRSRHYDHGSALGLDSENGTVATLSTVHTYGYGTERLDNRWAINFFADTVVVDGDVVTQEDGVPLVYRPLAVTSIDLTGATYMRTAGARMRKYEVDRNAYADGKLQGNDIVLFRYADVLLMRAEAMVRNGEDGSEPLNMVRERVGMPSRNASLATILDERLLELVWEGWRRQDLVRYGLFCTPLDLRTDVRNESDSHTIVFPIPQNVIDLNPNIKQNPGY